jgi:peptide/nickel transport system permease protein
MRRQIVARLWQSLIVVFVVTTISFFIIRLSPGDPFAYGAQSITPAIRNHWREQFGYDKPVLEQYARYVASVAHGQFGYSFTRHETVLQALKTTLPRTFLLTGLAFTLSFSIGMVIGVMQAARRGSWFDRISSGILVGFYSLPDFWGALMILIIFSSWIRLFPAGDIVDNLHDYMSPSQQIVDRLRHLVLPVGALTLLTTASIARYQRAAMLEVLPSDFIRTARAKGVPERAVLWRHGLRMALTPMVALGGLLFPALLGGALFVERVFNWPGMGLMAASAITTHDFDLVTATVIVGSLLVVVGNFFADLLHMAIDPRIRD